MWNYEEEMWNYRKEKPYHTLWEYEALDHKREALCGKPKRKLYRTIGKIIM